MIRPTRALRTSIMLSAVTLICIPAQAMARDQRAQPHAIPAASEQTLEPADPRTRVGRANAAARVEPERTSYFNAIQQYDRKSVVSGKSVSVRVDLGGRRISKKKKTQ